MFVSIVVKVFDHVLFLRVFALFSVCFSINSFELQTWRKLFFLWTYVCLSNTSSQNALQMASRRFSEPQFRRRLGGNVQIWVCFFHMSVQSDYSLCPFLRKPMDAKNKIKNSFVKLVNFILQYVEILNQKSLKSDFFLIVLTESLIFLFSIFKRRL